MSVPVKQRYAEARATLEPEFGVREARSLSRLIFEDGFGITFPERSNHIFPAPLEPKLRNVVQRVLANEPVQYVLERTIFFDLPLTVRPGVLIPRQETEELVDWMLANERHRERASVLDIGTGSGCIALALKSKRPNWRVEGCDVSSEAIAIARENMQQNGLPLVLALVNILHRHEWRQYNPFDLLVSNPPYIPPTERHLMSASTLEHEPREALFVEGDDALLYYKTIATFAKTYLREGGALYFECNEYNAADLRVWLGSDGWQTELKRDLNQKDRMLRCVRAPQ